jgi:hypothetical protein
MRSYATALNYATAFSVFLYSPPAAPVAIA